MRPLIKLGIVINALFGMLGWFMLMSHTTIAIVIIVLNWIIFLVLIGDYKKEKLRRQQQKLM